MKDHHELVRVAETTRSSERYNASFPRNSGPPVIESRPNWSREFLWSTVLRVLRRHWLLSLAFAVVVSVGVTLISLCLKDVYSPVAHIEVNPPGEQALTTTDVASGQEDSKTDYVQTQIEILQGDELATAVIKNLEL